MGVSKDVGEAARLFRLASDQGDAHGHLSLGLM
jgi:TPR repeat protein